MAKQSPCDTRIGGSTGVIRGFLHVEFQFYSDCCSSHQSLQCAKTGFVERTAMSEIARLQKCRLLFPFNFVHYSLHLEQYLWFGLYLWTD